MNPTFTWTIKKILTQYITHYFVENLLNSLLSIEATRSVDYPTIEDLMSDPFFANAIVRYYFY